MEEVEVKTGGYEAEFGRNTGGVVNVITKSGGNEFHGDVFGYFDNTSMKAQGRVDASPAYSQGGDIQGQPYYSKNDRTEFGLGVGGYFWKDRIWFYGAYDRVDQKIETYQTAGVNAGAGVPPRRQVGPLFRQADVPDHRLDDTRRLRVRGPADERGRPGRPRQRHEPQHVQRHA